MKMNPADYVYNLCQTGFGKFPEILKTDLVEAVRFANSGAKFDRFYSGKAYTSDLDGAEAEKRYLSQRWRINKGNK